MVEARCTGAPYTVISATTPKSAKSAACQSALISPVPDCDGLRCELVRQRSVLCAPHDLDALLYRLSIYYYWLCVRPTISMRRSVRSSTQSRVATSTAISPLWSWRRRRSG